MYYGCLSAISANHNARNCKNRKEFKVWKKIHPISLHGYKAEKSKVKQPDGNSSKESKANVNCTTTNTKFDVIIMCAGLVLVRHKLSNYIVKTYAMLDNCGQATFMQNKCLRTFTSWCELCLCFTTNGSNFQWKWAHYAFRKLLGWCAVGPMIYQTKAGKCGCNRIMFTSTDTVNPGSHYFTLPTKVRETSIKRMLKRTYEHDFVEP